jgi:MoxR-like ATPase
VSEDAENRAALEELGATGERIIAAVGSVIDGKAEVVRLVLTVLLAEGHVLLEDVPGVGKTMLAKAVARSVGCSVSRIQFTPDLLPSDITGVSAYVQQTGEFEFKPGPVFANVVLGDEINRAPSRTQSALLECMEERLVTADGTTYPLEPPFMVIATQNPIEMEGTFRLPEAQRDRFMARISIGYPTTAAELGMLEMHAGPPPLDRLVPVTDAAGIRALSRAVRGTHVPAAVREYAVSLAAATRAHPDLRLGASPRATLHLVRACRAAAALHGRDRVISGDVRALAVPVLAHRLLPAGQAADVLADLLDRLPAPEADAAGRPRPAKAA